MLVTLPSTSWSGPRNPSSRKMRFPPPSYFEQSSVRIHHVHADSLFDFRPRSQYIGAQQRKFSKSALEVVLDMLLQGSTEDLETMRETLRADGRPRALFELASEIDADDEIRCHDRVYVAVIGVYTDLKVKTLLTGLRTLYNLPNLAVSDSLTASATLERHLGGLDFAVKVLGVEVIQGINDLVRFLGGTGELEDESKVVAADSFSRYQSFSRISRTCSRTRRSGCRSTRSSPSGARVTCTRR